MLISLKENSPSQELARLRQLQRHKQASRIISVEEQTANQLKLAQQQQPPQQQKQPKPQLSHSLTRSPSSPIPSMMGIQPGTKTDSSPTKSQASQFSKKSVTESHLGVFQKTSPSTAAYAAKIQLKLQFASAVVPQHLPLSSPHSPPPPPPPPPISTISSTSPPSTGASLPRSHSASSLSLLSDFPTTEDNISPPESPISTPSRPLLSSPWQQVPLGPSSSPPTSDIPALPSHSPAKIEKMRTIIKRVLERAVAYLADIQNSIDASTGMSELNQLGTGAKSLYVVCAGIVILAVLKEIPLGGQKTTLFGRSCIL